MDDFPVIKVAGNSFTFNKIRENVATNLKIYKLRRIINDQR